MLHELGRSSRHRWGQRGGVVLDLILATAFLLVGAFALNSLGISFTSLVTGARHFFGG